MLVGAALSAITGILFLMLAPARFEATVVLYHTPGSGIPESGRDFVILTLAQTGFSPGVVTGEINDAKTEALLASKLSVVATDASKPFAELRLVGTDSTALAATLNAVATQMIDRLRANQEKTLQRQLSELDAALANATQRQRELKAARPDYGSLSPWTHDAVVAATKLARQRLELELLARYRPWVDSAFDHLTQRRDLNAVVQQQAQLKLKISENVHIDSGQFELESALALAGAELPVLQQTKQRMNEEFEFFKPLQVLRPAEVVPLARAYTPVVMLIVAGGLIGALAGGLVWSRRQSLSARLGGLKWSTRQPADGTLNARAVEKCLKMPVLGVMAQYLTDYGERERCPLAQSDSQHLAIVGVRSLRVALHLLAQGPKQAGPLVVAEVGDRQHASHIIANLAVVAAQAGERVLIVEASAGQGVLSTMFASGENTTRPIVLNGDELIGETDLDEHPRKGSIHFLISDDLANDSGATPLPVPSEVMQNFDRLFIHAGDGARARDLLNRYGTGVGLLVCSSDMQLSALRKARVKFLHGVVLCGHPLDESAYQDGPAAG